MRTMLLDRLKKQLAHQEQHNMRRRRKVIESTRGNHIVIRGKSLVDFSNNDYLGLRKHPEISDAFTQGINKYGFGSGASAQVSGYTQEHEETEQMFSEWLEVDKAILFNSGYAANIGVISALLHRSDTIFSDKLCHASLLDGITLSRAKHFRYSHCDTDHLQDMANSHSPTMIITESIFSMEGDIAPIQTLAELANKYHSGLLIDDGHGIGILGKGGRGIIDHLSLTQDQYSCLVLPLGKAFNAMGGIVAGRSDIIDAILQFAPSYRYTTSLPAAVCCAIQASLKVVDEEQWRRKRLAKNIQYFIAYAKKNNLSLISDNETPIKPILIGSNEKVIEVQDTLLEQGIHVSAIRPPTVPKDKARLRISINCHHTEEQITHLIDCIVRVLQA